MMMIYDIYINIVAERATKTPRGGEMDRRAQQRDADDNTTTVSDLNNYIRIYICALKLVLRLSEGL